MLRSFVGAVAAPGRTPEEGRLRAALESEGQPLLLRTGPLAVAYTGPPLPDPPAGGPACVLDGAVYDAIGLDLPARDGPELEAFLASAYARMGPELLGRLRGDFALILFDPEAGSGLLARDHLGGRGAVWHSCGSGLLLATEAALLVRALPSRPGPDSAAVAHWLAVSGMPGDRSLYSGVRRVEAGCAVRIDGGGGGRAYRFWSPTAGPRLGGGRGDHVAALRQALERSVRRRIAPHEQAAVLLSGGLDSGTVTALAATGPPEQRALGAYSAIFPRHPSVDESGLIGELTGALGIPSTTIRVHGGSILQGALAYINRFELPPVSPNLFFWLPLQQRAADDGVAVMLDGEGGDELYGHSPYLLADRLRRGRLLSSLGLIRRLPGTGGRAPRSLVSFYLRRYGIKGLAPSWLHEIARRGRGVERYGPPWMRPEAAAAFITSDDSHSWKRQPGPRWRADLINRVTRGMGPGLAYDHIRRRAILAGLEPRHPLIDVDVIELVLRIPPEHAFDPHRSRPLLRESMAGLLPDSVRMRPAKSNFDAVFHESLTGPDLPAARALLGRRDAEVGAFAELAKVRELIAAPPEKAHARMWWALHVWRLMTAECWLLAQTGPEAVERVLDRPLLQPDVAIAATRT